MSQGLSCKWACCVVVIVCRLIEIKTTSYEVRMEETDLFFHPEHLLIVVGSMCILMCFLFHPKISLVRDLLGQGSRMHAKRVRVVYSRRGAPREVVTETLVLLRQWWYRWHVRKDVGWASTRCAKIEQLGSCRKSRVIGSRSSRAKVVYAGVAMRWKTWRNDTLGKGARGNGPVRTGKPTAALCTVPLAIWHIICNIAHRGRCCLHGAQLFLNIGGP